MATFWTGKKVVVTGGAGFVGSVIRGKLKERGATHVIVPRSKDYDLTDIAAVRKLYDAAAPDIVLHLAAEVGGIGANMANPGRYFFANMAMALHLIEQARVDGMIERGGKFVQVGTICAYPNLTPVPFVEDDLWNGYPEKTNAPYGVAVSLVGAIATLVVCSAPYGTADESAPSSRTVVVGNAPYGAASVRDGNTTAGPAEVTGRAPYTAPPTSGCSDAAPSCDGRLPYAPAATNGGSDVAASAPPVGTAPYTAGKASGASAVVSPPVV